MGKVYLAEQHIEIGKRVALKVLHPSYSRMPDLVERFRREARAASKIGHPNIVDVTDSGTTNDGSVYFVMENLEGVELGSVIEREGAIRYRPRSLKITTQICRALAAAHAVGIIHRDLKPENIYLIARDGAADVVKVLDFGIAKTTEAEAARERRLTSPGMAMGTPEYMSPEQAAGRPADARCDVYALGAILYEMTTGTPPYSGDNFMEILTKKATTDPPPPHTLRPDLPTPVSTLVVAAMAREPDARPQTMEAFEYELNKCLAGRGVAVAQILGMTTDANLVAQSTSGLVGAQSRRRDRAARAELGRHHVAGAGEHARRLRAAVGRHDLEPDVRGDRMSTTITGPQTPLARPSGDISLGAVTASSSGSMRALTEPPVRASQPNLSTRSSDHSLPIVTEPVEKRSALGVLGWIILAAVLCGGVGALIYVAVGERGQHARTTTDDKGSGTANATAPSGDGSGGSAIGSAGSNGAAAMLAVGSGSGTSSGSGSGNANGSGAGSGSGDANSGSNGSAAIANGSDDTKPVLDKKTHKPIIPVHRPVHPVIASDDPRVLLKQGDALQKSGDWDQARGVYMRLERVKGYAGKAIYLQAFCAFNSHDLDAALGLADKARTLLTGPEKVDAQLLYGDALYRAGDFGRAKDVYKGLLKVPGRQSTVMRKLAAANRQLHLPDADGATP